MVDHLSMYSGDPFFLHFPISLALRTNLKQSRFYDADNYNKDNQMSRPKIALLVSVLNTTENIPGSLKLRQQGLSRSDGREQVKYSRYGYQ